MPGLAMLGVLTWYSISRRNPRTGLLAYVGFALFAGGSVATLGGHIGEYFFPFIRWSVFVAVIWVIGILIEKVGAAKSRSGLSAMLPSRILSHASIFSLAFVLIFSGSYKTISINQNREALALDDDWVFNQSLGGYVSKDAQRYLDHIASLNSSFIEEYSGLASALLGPPAGPKVDAVIHALGAQRTQFNDILESRPPFVISSSTAIDPWFSWNISTNWWFYRHLYMHYTPHSVEGLPLLIWEHTANRNSGWERVTCAVDQDGERLVIEDARPGFYEISIFYESTKRGQGLFLVQNNLNRPFRPYGYVSVNPNQTSSKFPAAVFDGVNSFQMATSEGFRVSELFEVHRCDATKLFAPEQLVEAKPPGLSLNHAP